MNEVVNMNGQPQMTEEQKKERDEQILTGKRGHCLELAIRVSTPGDSAETVLEKAREFLSYLQNG